MQASFAHRVFVSVALAAWNRRTALLFLLSVASLTWNFMALSAFFGWDALSSCRSLYHKDISAHVLRYVYQVWRSLRIPLNRSYLYVLLNIILMTIVLKSGVFATAKEADLPQAFSTKTHRIASSKASLDDFDDERSGDSNPIKQEQTVGEKRQSLFTIEPLETDQEAVSEFSPRYDTAQHNFSDKAAAKNSPRSSAVEDLEMTVYEQKAVSSYNRDLILEDTLPQVVLLIKDGNTGGRPDEQLVQIGGVEDTDEEMSTEELNRRADAFIQKVRKDWWLQRKDSYNRLCGLVSGEDRVVCFYNET